MEMLEEESDGLYIQDIMRGGIQNPEPKRRELGIAQMYCIPCGQWGGIYFAGHRWKSDRKRKYCRIQMAIYDHL